MRPIFILTFFVFIGLQSFALTDRIRIGFYTSPGISWSKPAGNDMDKGKPRFGIDYGFTFEYWFAPNYGLSTGLGGAFDGCNIRGRDVFELDALGNKVKSVNEKYAFHYVVLPVYLKLKTNPIKSGNFSIWGKVGIDLQVTAAARASYSNKIGSGDEYSIEKENILRKANEVTHVIPNFRSNFIDVRLGAAAGFEYSFDERTSLLVGLQYHNGFINNILDHDPKKEPNVMRFMSLQVGVLF